jgi:hypothetical protein
LSFWDRSIEGGRSGDMKDLNSASNRTVVFRNWLRAEGMRNETHPLQNAAKFPENARAIVSSSADPGRVT